MNWECAPAVRVLTAWHCGQASMVTDLAQPIRTDLWETVTVWLMQTNSLMSQCLNSDDHGVIIKLDVRSVFICLAFWLGMTAPRHVPTPEECGCRQVQLRVCVPASQKDVWILMISVWSSWTSAQCLFVFTLKGGRGISDVSPLSGILGLSVWSHFSLYMSPLLFFCLVLLLFYAFAFGPFSWPLFSLNLHFPKR